MSKTDWIQQEIDNLKSQGLYNNIRTIGSPQGAWLNVDGAHAVVVWHVLQVLAMPAAVWLGLAEEL